MHKVLLVDDSISIRQQVGAILTSAGYLMIEAIDGFDGLAKLAVTPDVALIIVDINMPRMNGLEMVERVKSDLNYRALPVLMLTSEGDPGMIERARQAGVKAWVIEPFKPPMLLATIRRMMGDAPVGEATATTRAT